MSEQIEIKGVAGPEEERAVRLAVEKFLQEEKDRSRPSAWRMAGRAQATRSAVSDLRTSTKWRASAATAWSSAPTDRRHGRGDTK